MTDNRASRSFLVAAIGAFLMSCGSCAVAAEPKPAIRTKAKAVEISVKIEPSTEKDKSSGLTFNYPQYAVGPYVEGAYIAFVPWKVFANDLSPEGKTIFAGEKHPETAGTDK